MLFQLVIAHYKMSTQSIKPKTLPLAPKLYTSSEFTQKSWKSSLSGLLRNKLRGCLWTWLLIIILLKQTNKNTIKQEEWGLRNGHIQEITGVQYDISQAKTERLSTIKAVLVLHRKVNFKVDKNWW